MPKLEKKKSKKKIKKVKKIVKRKRVVRKKKKGRKGGVVRKSIVKIVSFALIICMNLTGLLAVGKTFAYFFDNEDSNGNTFAAGSLDLTVRSGQGNFVPGAENMMPGQQVNRDIYVGKIASSLPLKHKVSFEFISGNIDLCNQLDLKIWYNHYFGPPSGGYANRDMRLTYNGKLSVLTDYNHADFEIPHPDDQFDTDSSDGTEQWFYYSIVLPSAIADSFQGEVCNFKFVFEAWQNNLPDSSGGFTDEEELGSIIKTGYWNPPVVLNEFLPYARNYLEFIELYNKTASSIDLNGFYIKANDNTIPIDAGTTALYSSGLTTILPNSWLVVTTGGNLINDSSGKVTLYNQNGVEVDSYTYDASDYNVNNTPGWTNNLVGYWPFDNDTQDKSGNGNNGIMYGASLVSGKINQALSFDGVNDYVTIANSDDFDFGSGEFSAEFWIKTDSSSRQWVGTRYENYGPGWGLGTQNSHTLGYIRTLESGTNKTEVEGTVDVANNDWHHLIMVRIGDEIKIYTDGSFEKEGTLAGDVNNDEPIEIGRISWSGGSQYFKGLIDEVKIYNRALNASEILEHYNDAELSGTVPLDKSYARIPDGIGSWVDPIPTPGRPNILESEIINQKEIVEEAPIEEPISDEIFDEELLIEEKPVNEEVPTILEEPIAEEEPIVEEEIVEEPVAEEDQTVEEAPITEEEPIEEEVLDLGDEITSEEITETSGETTEDIIEDVIEEVVEAPVTEETPVDETPAVEEQPAVVPDNDFSTQGTTGESEGDGGNDTSNGLDGGSPTESAVESSGDTGDIGGDLSE